MKAKKRVAILGASDLGRSLAHYLESTHDAVVAGFYDDFAKTTEHSLGSAILGRMDDLSSGRKKGIFDEVLIAVGYKHFDFRAMLFERCMHENLSLYTLVHPSAYVDPSAKIGAGCVLFPRVCVDAHSELEENVLMNAGSILAHDSKIKRHSFVAPGVAIAGFVEIGECSMIGVGSAIKDGVKIEKRVVVGAGAVVVKNIDQSGTYVGVPAKLL